MEDADTNTSLQYRNTTEAEAEASQVKQSSLVSSAAQYIHTVVKPLSTKAEVFSSFSSTAASLSLSCFSL